MRIEIERVHLEEDTGKSTHVGGATGRIQGADHSIVDYNRAGIPLVEIVTKPIEGTDRLAPRSPAPTSTELREVMRALGVSDVRMDQGSMRCDVNVSLMPRGSTSGAPAPRPRTSTRFRSVERSVRGEIERQAAILAEGGRIIQETRHFHEDTGLTTSGPVEGRGAGLPLLPRARPGPDRARPGVGRASSRPSCPSCRRSAARGCRRSGASPTSTWPPCTTPTPFGLVEATVEAGAPAADARKWWMGELARRANEGELAAGRAADHAPRRSPG